MFLKEKLHNFTKYSYEENYGLIHTDKNEVFLVKENENIYSVWQNLYVF